MDGSRPALAFLRSGLHAAFVSVTTSTDGTATRAGWWLGQLVRATVAVLVLGGLLGAALGAAQPSDLSTLSADLQDRRVAEVVFTDSSSYTVPGLPIGDSHAVVRWKIVGSGWRTAPVGIGSVSPNPSSPDPSELDTPGRSDRPWQPRQPPARAGAMTSTALRRTIAVAR